MRSHPRRLFPFLAFLLLCRIPVGAVQPVPAAFPPDLPALARELVPVPVPGVSAAVSEWTVMYFINGKNNLESSALMDMNQLELAGSDDRVKILVELGRMNGQPEGDDHADGDWTGVRRYLVTRDPDTSRINSPVLMQRANYDMGDWKELAGFVLWVKRNYPARRYALILWDHGNGWLPVAPANAPHFAAVSKGFSLDDETGNEFSTIQIGAALRAAGGVNFLMLDGCNMQMASVAYELKDLAETLVASEEMEPGVAVRYAQYHALLKARPRMNAGEFAVNAVRTYRDYFTSGGETEEMKLTQSALRLSKMAAFRAKADAWAAEALRAEPSALRYGARKAKYFGDFPDYKDLGHFVQLVSAASSNQRLKTLGSELLAYMKEELIIENWAQDQFSHGLAVYVPRVYDPLYDQLSWSRGGLWPPLARRIAEIY